MFRSATVKLTLWYLAIVMAISLIFSVVLYEAASGELSRSLHHQSQRIYSQFPVFQNDPILRPSADAQSGDHRLLFRLVGLNVIVLVGAGFASYFLARRTLQPIEEAHEQQKRFTADVSHELRTPLTALKMESEVALMSDTASANELREILVSNLEEVDKLEILINNLLRLTRLEADEVRQGFSTTTSETLVNQAIDQVLKLAKSRSITLQSKTLDAVVFGDKDSLIQLLVILLDNAIKYSPNESTVQLTTVVEKGHLVISITDEGAGIAQADLERIFDRFYRAESSRTKNETTGYGLGLSIAKLIADVHDGAIIISSKPGKGTTAKIELPLYIEQTANTKRRLLPFKKK